MPLETVSRTAGIVRTLRAEIISGDLEPGQILVESQIGARFHVSKTPAREALLHLSEMGLVTVQPGKGYRVTELTLRQAMAVFECRMILEGAIVELATIRASPIEAQGLQELALRARDTVLTGDQLVRLNKEFHLALAQLTRNERLQRILSDQLDDVQRVMQKDWGSSKADNLVDEHITIAKLVSAGDGQGARRAMEEHIESTRRRLLEL